MIGDTKEFKEKVLFYENNMELPFREKYVTITKEVLKLCEEYKKIELLDNVAQNKLEKAKIFAIKVAKPLEEFMEEKSSERLS